MQWINVGDAIIDLNKVNFVVKHVGEEGDIFSLRFHFCMEKFIEIKFDDKKNMEEFYDVIYKVLSNGKNNMGDPPKDNG